MNLRPLLLSTVLGLAAIGGGVHSPDAHACGHVGLSINLAPPPPRHERAIVRPGYVWTPGVWRWNGRRHVWVRGYYVPERPGYAYRPAYWRQYGPRWRLHAGYWVRR